MGPKKNENLDVFGWGILAKWDSVLSSLKTQEKDSQKPSTEEQGQTLLGNRASEEMLYFLGMLQIICR